MKRGILRGTFLSVAGAGAVAAVSFLRNGLIARTMGPGAFGLWNLCLVTSRLLVESHVGALSALSLDGPILRGTGKAEEARALERRAQAATLLFAAIGACAAAAVLRTVGGPGLLGAAILLGCMVVLQQQLAADLVAMRSRGEFGRTAGVQIVFAAVHAGALLLLLPGRYLTGALLAWCMGLAAAVVFERRRRGEALPIPRLAHLEGLGATLRRGGTTYAIGLVFTLLLQTDRLVVASLLGAEALGHYGILLMGGSGLLFLPDVFSTVLWPFAGERFGRSGMRPEALAGMAREAVGGLALVLGGALVLALGFMDLLVAEVLPFFRAALPALRPYLAGVYLLALALPLRYLLVTAGAGQAVLRAEGGALVAAVILEVIAAVDGLGIAGVAMAHAVAAGFLLASFLRSVARVFGPGARALRLALLGAALLAGALGLDALLAATAPEPGSVPGILLRVVLPAALTAAAGIGLVLRGPRGEGAEGGGG